MGALLSRAAISSDQNDKTVQLLDETNPALLERLSKHVDRMLSEELGHGEAKAHAPAAAASSTAATSVAAAAKTPLVVLSERIGGGGGASEVARQVSLADYEYPFENVIFEGGGSKGRIYYGAMKCLKDAGIQPRRFAGASAGAVTAAFFAINLPLDLAWKYLSLDVANILSDHSYGLLSLFPNLLRHFGWNPGHRFYEHVGQIMQDHAGSKDITFEEVYKKYGNELCIPAVNSNLQAVEYFHVKTTPHMPIRLAVRMSVSIPGFFSAVPYSDPSGNVNYYVDGGVTCNFPVHVYDGWWLSLKPEDSFYRKLRPLSAIPRLMDTQQRFGTYNDKTLGFLVYAVGEEEIFQFEFDRRIAEINVPRPDTALFRKKQSLLKGEFKSRLAHAALVRATDKFFEALRDADISNDDDATVSKAEFHSVFANLKPQADGSDETFTQADAVLLFGQGYDVDQIFASLDRDKNGVIDYSEMCAMLDKTLALNRRFTGYSRREITTLAEFGSSLVGALTMQSMRAFMTGRDLERSVGLDADYIDTMDFELADEDLEFLAQQGYEITKAFLWNYAKSHNLPTKIES